MGPMETGFRSIDGRRSIVASAARVAPGTVQVASTPAGATLSAGPNTGCRGALFTADVAVTPGRFPRVNVGCGTS